MADLESEGGNSARARSRSSHEVAVPPLHLAGVQESDLRFPTPVTQAGPEGPPAKAGDQPPEIVNILFQQNITNEGCSIVPHVTNTWQETNNVNIETVIEAAERRHQEVVQDQAAVAEQNHRYAVAQLTGEAVRALDEQSQGHA